VKLTPKALAVLRVLVTQPSQLVTKEALFQAVWPETVVSDAALTSCIQELRQALRDDFQRPRYIETVYRRGYRFLPSITTQPVSSSKFKVSSSDTQDSALTAQEAQLPLPDKPSLAVMPFTNMSSDPEQEYFSDGLTDDLITDLSQLSGLFVIARHSVFTYKGKAVKVQDVSKELGVWYVLEGSVRKADGKVRINAQLVDAATGHHVWAERYDRLLTDIFALQNEIEQKIVTTLKLQLTLWEQGILVRKRTDNVDAYDLYLQGLASFFRFTKEAHFQARQLFAQAIELDPQYAEAYASLGGMYQMAGFFQWSQDPSRDLEQALALVQQAVALDDSLPSAHNVLSIIYLIKRQYEQARVEAERTITLAPNSPLGYRTLGGVLNFTGQAEQTIGMLEQALRLDPRFPLPYQAPLSWAYLGTRRYDEAIALQQKALRYNRNLLESHLILTISYSESGREEEARAEAVEVLRLSPTFSLDMVKQTWPYQDPADLERTLAHQSQLKPHVGVFSLLPLDGQWH
jgi:TolB-like protein/Tfp pilus assembly protein PilF